MLTVDNAYLAESTTPAPAVTLRLDGHQTSVVDSFNPHREIPATALWHGQQLRITSSTDKYTTTQVISVEATQLVVVTSSNSDPQRRVVLRYKKK
jgi:hypothetical protein